MMTKKNCEQQGVATRKALKKSEKEESARQPKRLEVNLAVTYEVEEQLLQLRSLPKAEYCDYFPLFVRPRGVTSHILQCI